MANGSTDFVDAESGTVTPLTTSTIVKVYHVPCGATSRGCGVQLLLASQERNCSALAVKLTLASQR